MRPRPVAARCGKITVTRAARARNAFAPRARGLWRRELCAFDSRGKPAGAFANGGLPSPHGIGRDPTLSYAN